MLFAKEFNYCFLSYTNFRKISRLLFIKFAWISFKHYISWIYMRLYINMLFCEPLCVEPQSSISEINHVFYFFIFPACPWAHPTLAVRLFLSVYHHCYSTDWCHNRDGEFTSNRAQQQRANVSRHRQRWVRPNLILPFA